MKNTKILIPFILFLAAIIVYIILSQNFKKQNNPSNLFYNFSETFLKEKFELINTLNTFEKSYQTSDNFKHNDIILFCFQKDSLIFWNSNEVLPPKSIFLSDTGFNVIQLANGYYQIYKSVKKEYTFIGLNLIKHNYPYQNEYLPNTYNKSYQISQNVDISLKSGEFNLKINNIFYLSLKFPNNQQLSQNKLFILFLLFLAQYILLIVLLYNIYSHFSKFFKKKLLLVIAFSADIIIIRIFLYIFKFPKLLYSSEIFSPANFSYSLGFSSIGDLIINSISIFAIIYFLFRFLPEKPALEKNNIIRIAFRIFTIFLHLFIFYKLISDLQLSIINDSTHSLDLSNIFVLDLYSYAILISFSIICFSYFILAIKLFNYAFAFYHDNKKVFIITLIFTIIIASIYFSLNNSTFIFILPSILLLLFVLFKLINNSLSNFYHIIIYLLLFSSILSYTFNQFNSNKLNEEKKILSISLLQTNNPISEYKLSKYYKSIIDDTIIQFYLKNTLNNIIYEDSIQTYLSETYLSKAFPDYLSLTTICTKDKILDIQPEGYIIPCYEYFNDFKTIYGDTTSYPCLYNIKNNESSQYLIEFLIELNIQKEIFSFIIFSELLYNNTIGEGLGYPELLIDSRIDNYVNTSQLSYAKYYNNNLIYKIGKFEYNISSSSYPAELNDAFFNYKGFKHYIYKSDDYTIIISSKKQGIIERLSTFSFLLIFFLLLILLYSLIFILPYQFTSFDLNYRNKLQVSIILIILFVFVLIGSISISYMINLYEEKNSDFLKEKTNSVLIELEHKLSNEQDINSDQNIYLSSLLEKFSLVFFSDINLYNLDGKLIATSRPQVFEMSLISDMMNPIAFDQLSYNKEALYLHNEQIGCYNYLSAYTAFRNNDNKIVAYLNLPYFARQTELRHEISIFLTTFINVYILFVALAIVISLIISRYTTRPLQLLKEKLANLSIDKSNEKIEWKGRDEIGKLVAEYNRMVEELGKNAELLAQSERESAWREMAKQVAHEIKNPLTPMKLSVQYLQKAWNDKSPDWDHRLKRFTKTIVEQIDTLSTIASEFSDFAKMPSARIEDADIKDIIQSSIELYRDYNNITINFQNNEEYNYAIKADKKQLLRVFNNLIKNSTQALSDTHDGKIDILLTQDAGFYNISIADNGPGIPEEISNKIFYPSFTTKTSGMGLGLAIVNSIITSYGGTITFESEPDKGTIFHITLAAN